MDLGLLIRGDRPWADTLAIARHAEESGWSSIWYPDHFMPFSGDVGVPYNEGWTIVSALAGLVPRVRIGHMVSCANFRHPAVVANMAAGVDTVSGGRFILGLGCGSQENEHRAYGIPFPSLPERMEHLDEACEVVRGLFGNKRTTFDGRHFQLKDAPMEPKGIQRPIPLLVGTNGPRLGLSIVARHADQWNFHGSAAAFGTMRQSLAARCEEVGRKLESIRCTVMTNVQLTDDHAGASPLYYYDLETPTISGTGEQLVHQLRDYADAGCEEVVIGDMSFGAECDEVRGEMDRFREAIGSAPSTF